MTTQDPGIVLITGAMGRVGRDLARRLGHSYDVVGIDLPQVADGACVPCDLTDDASVDLAFSEIAETRGQRIASVIHLAAYFDFSGRETPLYDAVNVEGTRRLLRRLQHFEVGQFIYSSTMLVHAPVAPGEMIDEASPLGPQWAYPRSKAETEQVIREEAGDIPVLILRMAGLYDERTAVPTLSHQIARRR